MHVMRARGGGGSLTPVAGPLSIAVGTVVVEVLVGCPQKQPGVRADVNVNEKKVIVIIRINSLNM